MDKSFNQNNRHKKKRNTKNNKSTKLECCICYEKFKSYVIKTKCKHVMCLNCLVQLRKAECPMCRANISHDLPDKIVNIINNNSRNDQRNNSERTNVNNLFNSDRFDSVFNDLSSNMINNGLNGFYSTHISFNNDTIYNDTQFFSNSSNRNNQHAWNSDTINRNINSNNSNSNSNSNNNRRNTQNLTNNILAPFFEYFL